MPARRTTAPSTTPRRTRTRTPGRIPPHRAAFGRYLSRLLAERKLSVVGFAAQIGVDPSMLRHVLAGYAPLPAAMIDGSQRLSRPKAGRGTQLSPRRVCIPDELEMQGEARRDFIVRARAAQCPPEAAQLMMALWRKLNKTKA
jgi:hypothetical protein